jgi:SWIM zinc finger
VEVWTGSQVLALAPDGASGRAGQRLATPRVWSRAGVSAEPALLWGLCQGSGTRPYQVAVDLTGPAYTCSCPSRKIPCKHALGLLLLWSAGELAAGVPGEWAGSWLAEREARADRADRAAERQAALDPAASAAASAAASRKRAEQRAGRVAAGLDELDQWLRDQVRTGLAGLQHGGYGQFEGVARRMVDAQAPAVASALRRLPAVVAGGEGWPGRLLEELALLHLTVRAHQRLDDLPDGLRATVRARVGYPTSQESVLASPPVADRWAVLGLRDHEDERLVSRRIWLRGSATGRPAVVLSYAPPGMPLEGSLVPGTVVDADLHFYPGAAPLRAVVGERRGEPGAVSTVAGGSIAAALSAYAAALAADPWVGSWPVVLAAVVPVPGEPWLLTEDDSALPVVAGSCDAWRLLALSGGQPLTVVAECAAAGVRPVSVVDGERLVQV